MKKFNLTEFTDMYLHQNDKWYYDYFLTFWEMKALVDEYIDIKPYLVQEVSVSEMLKLIEKSVPLEWFLINKVGGVGIRKNGENYELHYPVEREANDRVSFVSKDLKAAIIEKLKSDLLYLSVLNIKD